MQRSISRGGSVSISCWWQVGNESRPDRKYLGKTFFSSSTFVVVVVVVAAASPPLRPPKDPKNHEGKYFPRMLWKIDSSSTSPPWQQGCFARIDSIFKLLTYALQLIGAVDVSKDMTAAIKWSWKATLRSFSSCLERGSINHIVLQLLTQMNRLVMTWLGRTIYLKTKRRGERIRSSSRRRGGENRDDDYKVHNSGAKRWSEGWREHTRFHEQKPSCAI